MTLLQATEQSTYKVNNITGNEKITKFLKTLGLYSGENITLISKSGSNYILNVKDSRYAIDKFLAENIEISI